MTPGETASMPEYVKLGSGPKTFILLPGLAFKSTLGSAELVAAAYGKLFENYTIYMFDGRNDLDAGYTIFERARRIAAKMKDLGISDAYVYGVSMGGMTGQILAARYPELVKKLALCATAATISEKTRRVIGGWHSLIASGEIQKAVHRMTLDIYAPATFEQYGASLEAAVGTLTEKEQRDFLVLVEAILGFDSTAELKNVRCPVWVAGSLGDKVLFPEGSEKLAELLGTKPTLYGEEYGHAVYDEAPGLKQDLLAFFEKE